MARYTKVLKSLAHNAVGNRRIKAVSPETNNYYVTGASLEDGDDYTLTLTRNGGLSNITVSMLPLVSAGTKFLSSLAYSSSDYKITGTMSDSSTVTLAQSMRVFGNDIVLSGANQGAINLHENSANGNAYVSLRAPADMGTDPSYILTLPTTDGDNGQYLISNGSGVLSWATPTDANYYVTGGTYSAGAIEFSGTTGFSNFTVDSIPTGTIGGSIAEDRIAVGTSTANTITGTSNFEWDAATLKMTNTGDTAITLLGDANRSGENSHAMAMRGKWDGTVIGTMMIMTGPDTTNKDDGQLAFYTASAGTQAERMRIDETGNVGIGTTAPVQKLHIDGYINLHGSDDQIRWGNSSNSSIRYNSSDGMWMSGYKWHFKTYDGSSSYTEYMTLATGGNLGIGTTAPEGVLHTANNSGVNIFQRSNDSASYGTNFYIRKSRGTVGSESDTQSGDLIGQIGFSPYYGDYDNYAASISAKVTGTLGTDTTPGYLAFSTAAAGANTVSQRMCIASDGKVGINTSSPAQMLHVEGGFRFRDGNSSSQRLEGFGWNAAFALVVSGTDALALCGGTPGVQFWDSAGNSHLAVTETGTNGAVLESPSSMYLISNDNLHLQADDAIQFLPDEADQTGGPVQVFNYRGGTEYVRFDGANQRVGIGTTAPEKTLHVKSAGTSGVKIQTSDASSYAQLQFTSPNTGYSLINFGDGDASSPGYIQYTHSSDLMLLKATKTIELKGASAAGYINFSTDNTERMRIKGDGKVGIGTTSPGALLHIDSDTTGDVEVLRLENSNASTTSIDSVTQSFRLRRDQDDYSYHAAKLTAVKEQGWTNSSATVDASLTFSTIQNETTSEKMRITSAGRVGIGTAAPAGKLHVVAGTASANDMTLYLPRAGTAAHYPLVVDNDDSPESTRAEPAIATIGSTTSTVANGMGAGRAISLVLGGTAGYNSGGSDYGDCGSLIFNASSNWTSSARRWLMSNAWGDAGNKGLGLAISATADTDPTISGSTPSFMFSVDGEFGIGAGTNPTQTLDVRGTTLLSGAATVTGLATLNSISMGGHTVDDILIDGDSYPGSSQDDYLITAKYLNTVSGAIVAAGGGGTIGGSITDNQIAFGATTANSIEGSSNLTFDGNHMTLAAGKHIYFNDTDASIHAGADSRLDIKGESVTFASGSTEVMRVNGGGVGIGTSSPSMKLQVVDTDHEVAEFESSHSAGASIKIDATSTGGTHWKFQSTADGSGHGGGKLSIQEAGTNRVAIAGGGNVGIGTTTPAEYLEINSSADDDPAFKLYNSRSPSASGALILQHRGSTINQISTGSAATPFRWTVQSTEMMRLDDTGLGIGTTSPNSLLEIVGTNPKIIVDGGGSDDASIELRESSQYGGRIYYDGDSGVFMKFTTIDGGTEKIRMAYDRDGSIYLGSADANDATTNPNMFIDQDGGKVGIGTTSPSTLLEVNGTISATAKSFNIEHPLYKDKRLVHGSLEGPEHGIYIRGTIESKEYGCLIELPEYWEAMCDDYTVQLTPHGPYTVYIKEKQKDKVMIACTSKDYKFDYYVVGSRTDETLEVVQDA